MYTVNLTWNLPNKRTDGTTLPADQIKHVRVSMSLNPEAFGFTPYREVPPAENKLSIPELEAGTWYFEGVVVDTEDRESAPATAVVDIALTEPNGLAEFSASLA